MLFHGLLVEILRLPFDDFEGISGALPQTGPQPIAELFGRKPGFPVYNLQGALGAGRNADPAAVTLLLIDLDDLPFDFHFFLLKNFTAEYAENAEFLKRKDN